MCSEQVLVYTGVKMAAKPDADAGKCCITSFLLRLINNIRLSTVDNQYHKCGGFIVCYLQKMFSEIKVINS
jgi:hypothetical protein